MTVSSNTNKKIVIGLTGGIATGKSTVAQIFKDFAATVIDADSIAKDVVAIGSTGHKQLKISFKDCFSGDILDRVKLKELIASDSKSKKELEKITHPLILQQLKNKIKQANGLVVIEVPLLFESGFNKICDYTVCCVCDYDTQFMRLKLRDGLSVELTQNLINAQIPTSQKAKLSNFIIDTNQSLESLEMQVLQIITKTTAVQ